MSRGVRGIDVNLLLVLQAVLEHRNLTKAGHELVMGPAAVSAGLARLRSHFDDELLVRDGRDFRLTPLAVRLQPVVTEAIRSAQAALGDVHDFDPATSARRFTVTLSEYSITVLAEPLTRAVARAAPGCSITFESPPRTPEAVAEALDRSDLLIVPIGFGMLGRAQPIFTDRFVCVVARDHPRLRDGALTLEDLQEISWVSAAIEAVPRELLPIERHLAAAGVGDRRLGTLTPNLLTVPYAVAGTRLAAFVPLRLARRCLDSLDLVIAETPIPRLQLTEAAYWRRRADDEASRWLRSQLHDVAVELSEDDDAPEWSETAPGGVVEQTVADLLRAKLRPVAPSDSRQPPD